MLQKQLFNLLKVTSNTSIRSNNIQTTIHRKNVHKASSKVDENEITHFKKLINEWWDERGIMKPLHSMNTMRYLLYSIIL